MHKEIGEAITSIDEKETRKKYIDPALKRIGWLDKYIKIEVNSVKSDFNAKEFAVFDGNIEKGVDRFVDYVLLDEDYSVLAIIEAKRFSKDEESGRIQARTYSKDIEKQVNRKIPIFLTNGRVWRFIDESGIERKVSNPFSQEDLRRRSDLYNKMRDPKDVNVNSRIVDRPKSDQIVRQLREHFSQGHRKALIQMATGTGKTRVAMAIIDLLINANMVRNVLFIADRTALVDQARTSGFEEFFTEPIADLRRGFTTSSRLYVSTIQTLTRGEPKKLFEKFSPAFFDLIVFDEAHRSIYDKNNLIADHFDAIKIGLTATPRDSESRNTYDLFECEYGAPTVEYSYDEAVREGVLVPYSAEIIETKVLSEGIKGDKLANELKDQLRRQEEDPKHAEYMGSQFDNVFMDDVTNALVIREFMAQCYMSDEGKPCKTIFFCASQRHADHMKKVFGKLFPHLSGDVQVVTSNMYRANDEVKRFKKESQPRIALSVGMLDTGIDVPEICNLVFVKPVFSHIRFWQMLGRGTRNFEACKNRDWLPEMNKKDFKIFDFTIGGHSNVKIHQIKASKEKNLQDNVITKIFKNRIKLLERTLDDKQKQLVSDKILKTIDSLDEDSFIVRERMPTIEKIKGNSFELEKYVKDLMKDISPLMILCEGGNVHVVSFVLQTEKLFGFVLDRNIEKIEEIRDYVEYRAHNILLKDSLTEIKDNKDKITKVLQADFWDDLTFDDVEFLVREISPLMKYYEPNKKKVVQVDAPDLVLSRESYEMEVKEDTELIEFLDNNPLIRNIRDGLGITSFELKKLEEQLMALRPEMTIENIQKHRHTDFIVFLKEIIGMEQNRDPKRSIENKFDDFIISKGDYTSRQLEFLLLLRKVFADRKYVELPDFTKMPLADEHPLDYFQISALESIIEQCNEIKVCC